MLSGVFSAFIKMWSEQVSSKIRLIPAKPVAIALHRVGNWMQVAKGQRSSYSDGELRTESNATKKG